MLTYELAKKKTKMTVSLQGDLDIEGTEIMNEELLPALLKSKEVNINLQDVPFVDSSGMGLLIQMVTTLKEKNKIVTISNILPDVNEVFEVLQIPAILGKEVVFI